MEKLLSKNIKFLRMREKLSQEQFAHKIGLNRGNIASYEKGTAEPSVNNILKIVKYFNIDLVDLIEYDLALLSELTSEGALVGELKDAEVFVESDSHVDNHLEKLLKRSEDLQQILQGLDKLHAYKKAKGLKDVDRLSNDYEDLLQVTQALMVAHEELLTLVKAAESNGQIDFSRNTASGNKD